MWPFFLNLGPPKRHWYIVSICVILIRVFGCIKLLMKSNQRYLFFRSFCGFSFGIELRFFSSLWYPSQWATLEWKENTQGKKLQPCDFWKYKATRGPCDRSLKLATMVNVSSPPPPTLCNNDLAPPIKPGSLGMFHKRLCGACRESSGCVLLAASSQRAMDNQK